MNPDFFSDDMSTDSARIDGLTKAASVLGVLSLFFAFSGGAAGIMFGSLGLLLALLSRGRESLSGKAKTAAITSGIGLVLGLVMMILTFSTMLSYVQTYFYQHTPSSPSESETAPEKTEEFEAFPELDWLFEDSSTNV